MTYKYAFLTFITVIILSLATWTVYFSNSTQDTEDTIHTSLLPDAYMEDVVATILDKQGRPSMKILTPRMVHFTNNDTTHLTAPQLTLYKKSPNPWNITANQAVATHGVDVVTFTGDVVIHHASDEKNPSTLIKTSVLTVQPNQQLAQTQALITLIQPNLTIHAVGMNANMKSGDIRLLSQTRGEYVPNS